MYNLFSMRNAGFTIELFLTIVLFGVIIDNFIALRRLNNSYLLQQPLSTVTSHTSSQFISILPSSNVNWSPTEWSEVSLQIQLTLILKHKIGKFIPPSLLYSLHVNKSWQLKSFIFIPDCSAFVWPKIVRIFLATT